MSTPNESCMFFIKPETYQYDQDHLHTVYWSRKTSKWVAKWWSKCTWYKLVSMPWGKGSSVLESFLIISRDFKKQWLILKARHACIYGIYSRRRPGNLQPRWMNKTHNRGHLFKKFVFHERLVFETLWKPTFHWCFKRLLLAKLCTFT